MKKDYTHIALVLDRSGSMAQKLSDTIGGLNKFVDDQKKVPGLATLTLAQFDTVYELVHDRLDIQKVPHIDLVPRGGTALYDAVGGTIVTTGEALKAMPESERPERVIFVIITDGLENSSREYSSQRIKEMIELQTNVYKWDFVYLGANQNAILEGEKMGIGRGQTMSYAQTERGLHNTYTNMSQKVSSVRGQSAGVRIDAFTKKEREESMEQDQK